MRGGRVSSGVVPVVKKRRAKAAKIEDATGM